MSRKPVAILFAVAGLAGLVTAALSSTWRFPGLGAGLLFLFLAGTLLSNATRIASALRHLVGESVHVEVWGTSLPTTNDEPLEVTSITALGAGLLIRLRVTRGGPSVLLKIAQPRSSTLEKDRVEIREAAYVSWGGTRLRPVTG